MKILDAIEDATGKPVLGRDSDETVEVFGGMLISNRNHIDNSLLFLSTSLMPDTYTVGRFLFCEGSLM